MDVVVKAHHCNVTEEFRAYVAEKITRLEKLDDRVIRVEVELSAERNKRQHDQASRVEITVRTRGPVVRAVERLRLDERTATGEAIYTATQAITTFTESLGGPDQAPPARIVLLSDGKENLTDGRLYPGPVHLLVL